MDIDNNAKRDWLRSIISDFYWFVVIMTICIGIIICCSSCSSSRPVVLERTLHDTVHINNIRLDSVYMHDSIYFESIVKENKTEVPVPVERKLPLWKQLAPPLYPIVFIIIIGIISMIWLIHRKK